VRAHRAADVLATALLAVLAGCTPSKTVEKGERAALPKPEDAVWRPATREDVVGDFESERVTGAAAASLRRAYYSFAADGTYSGAALVQEDARAVFQVLSGRWSLAKGTLRLEADEAKASAAPGLLRLESEGGTVVLRRARD